MNIFGKTLVLLFLVAGMLASCNSSISTPTMSDADMMKTAIATVSTGFAETQAALPTASAPASRPLPTIAFITLPPEPTPPEPYLIVDAARHPNVWNGPGTNFKVIGSLNPKKYPVIGKHADWWLIDFGNNQSGWINVLTDGISFVGNAEAVPDVAPPPSPTPYVFPSSTPLAFTDPSIPLSKRIVYYYLVGENRENPIPEGAVNAVYLLAPTYADETYTSDTAADLRTALEIVLHDERNDRVGPWLEAEIVDVTFRFGHAKVLLQGEYVLPGPPHLRDGWLEAPRMQILLTVFANPAVQSAVVSLNEDTIGNLGISDSRDAKPANYVFTRAEIQTYLKEQAYVTPSPRPPTPTLAPFVFIEPASPLPELLQEAIDRQWITAYGLPGDQIVTKIHPTRDGGFILVGNTVIDQPYGAWLLKLRADGLIVWQKSLPQVTALDVLETRAGDFILAGDLHWIKLDSQGNLLWQYRFERPSYHTGPIIRLVEESNGNIVVEALGSRAVFNAQAELQSFTDYTMHWDSQTYPGNGRDRSGESLWAGGGGGGSRFWVGKANLNSGWMKVFSFPGNPFGSMFFIQTTADGGALVGNSIRTYDLFDGVFDLIISRLSRDGSVRWQKMYRAVYPSDFHAFETQSGDFIVAGTWSYSLNDGIHSDVWILRLDRDGNIRWVKVYGTAESSPEVQDAVAVIHELSNGDLIFAGQTNGIGTGGQDMWVLKTNAQGEIPNCGLALDTPEWLGRTGDFSPHPETIALEGVSLIERERSPIVEDEQRPFGDAGAQTILICSPAP